MAWKLMHRRRAENARLNMNDAPAGVLCVSDDNVPKLAKDLRTKGPPEGGHYREEYYLEEYQEFSCPSLPFVPS
jgi:hypothetical protein